MCLSVKPSVFDLNLHGTYGHSFPTFREGWDHECWQDCLRTVDGFHPHSRVLSLCGPLPGQLQSQPLFLLGSISVHGLCSTHLSRKPARYRNLPAGLGSSTLSRRHSRSRRPQHAGRRQRDSRLAHLRRLGTGVDSYRAGLVCQRRLRSGVAASRLRFGLHHHRSLSFALSLGSIPSQERRREDAYFARWCMATFRPSST